MLTSSTLKSPFRIALLASVIGLGFAGAASAQEYDHAGQPVYQDTAPPDEITVYAPRHRSDIQEVSLSEAVRYDDLDLSTGYGIRQFHARIAATAREVCRKLETRYPVDVSDGGQPSCYRSAMENAEPLAMAAIDRANGGAIDNRRGGYGGYNDDDPDYNR